MISLLKLEPKLTILRNHFVGRRFDELLVTLFEPIHSL